MSEKMTEADSYRIVELRGERNEKGQKILEIVDIKWMYEEDTDAKRGVCYFPPEKVYGKLEKILRSHIDPKLTWDQFDVEIFTSADNYEKAQRRLKRLYKRHSDIESNTSDGDESQQILISKKRAAQTTNSASLSQRLPQTKGERKLELQTQMQSLRDGGKNDPLKVFFMKYLDIKLELLVFKLQDDIQNVKRAQQYDLNKKIEDLKSLISFPPSHNSTESSAKSQLGVEIPISTLENFEMFEQMLDSKAERNVANPDSALEKQEILKRVMKILAQGTHEWEKTVKAILQGLIKKAMQQHYSGLGRKT
ncbi:uncharacterized protein [Fopius arisanus]|uniref:Uncharacterized protein isoform X2 n=2 Tax=Fopius arisanus TaxID=64838 RepID=A0A9R1TP49_9HYME|nr:PREDICTED: uncharacterized protein LOC105272332 isoform X2 [Fopius arisanus]